MSSILSPSRHPASNTSQELQASGSPGYFGMSTDPESISQTSTGTRYARTGYNANTCRSAASPSHTLPFHSTQNPDFDAFRREVERSRLEFGKAATFSGDGWMGRSETAPKTQAPTSPVLGSTKPETIGKLDHEAVPRSPKRQLPDDAASLFERPRRNSPAWSGRSPLQADESKLPRLLDQLSTGKEADLFDLAESDSPSLVPMEKAARLIESARSDVLIFDLRVVTQYARSHIKGALNLCIPTTLLKRAAYNTDKLAETFKSSTHKTRFDAWQKCRIIIAYETNCTQLKEASNCICLLKKFSAQGWKGQSLIIRGSFADFESKFPHLVESSEDSTSRGTGKSSSLPPVIGGCPLPATKSAANPFFSNIRQNMDLIGGVGLIKISVPSFANKHAVQKLPKWLRQAVDEKDGGRTVSDRFLHIEQREQRRMQEALSNNVSYGLTSPLSPTRVTIAGVEKGSKNRYNNIWPFEHSRVKLQGVPSHGCDYVNANFVTASASKKNYIATQCPVPATFGDFWNMVWQRDVRVVVMLTAETEGGQVKGHNYWDQRQYGPIKLNMLSEKKVALASSGSDSRPPMLRRHTSHVTVHDSKSSDTPHVVVRKFAASNLNDRSATREITQIHYSGWPDFGAPAHPAHLLGLVQQCNLARRSSDASDKPVVVHCSAGCGRTGTFCTVDTVLDMLAKQKAGGLLKDDVDLIEKTVEEFRAQRLSLVQSLRQYVLCYETVVEALLAEQWT